MWEAFCEAMEEIEGQAAAQVMTVEKKRAERRWLCVLASLHGERAWAWRCLAGKVKGG